MNFPDEKVVARLKEEYPVGCRVVLDEMDDPYESLPIGGQGTCRGVDDVGNILVSWDCGSTLSVAYGADRCHRVSTEAEAGITLEHYKGTHENSTRCPRCGKETDRLLALSRRADIMICDQCGMEEALEDAGMMGKKPLVDWAVVKGSACD